MSRLKTQAKKKEKIKAKSQSYFPSLHINTSLQSIIDMKTFFFVFFLDVFCLRWKADYESPYINETDYQQIHPYVRSGFNYRPHDRARPRLNSFGNIITQHDRDQDRLEDVGETNRESDVNFYDNKYYDHFKMHR